MARTGTNKKVEGLLEESNKKSGTKKQNWIVIALMVIAIIIAAITMLK